VFAVLGSIIIAPQDRSTTKAARIDELISRYQQGGYFNGSILVAEHGKVIYEKGVGYANMRMHTPNTPQTKFGIASISKQFTAALVLMQVTNGNLRLDATVSEILPWYRKDTGSRITIEQLLRHTSGLPPDYDAPEFGDGVAAARHAEPKAFAQSVCQRALVSEPGTRWNYSNCGYILLGIILEQITATSFDEILQSQLLRPLEMNDTGMDNNSLVRLGGAVGYQRRPGPRYVPGPYIDRPHHPNILARLQTQSLRKSLDRLADELDSRLQRRLRLAGKHVVFYALAKSRRLDSLFDAPMVGLAAPQDSVDGSEKLTHSVVALWPRAVEPSYVTIWPRDEAIGTGCDVHNDLATLLHRRLPSQMSLAAPDLSRARPRNCTDCRKLPCPVTPYESSHPTSRLLE